MVVDTNVFVSALRSADGASREVLRRCLNRRHVPCMSAALFAEYRDLLARPALFRKSPLGASERRDLFNALMSVSRYTEIYYLWRPNLRDEADNHLVELAIAASAESLITHNLADFADCELRFPHLRVCSPAEFLKEN